MFRFALGLILGLFISTAFADKISAPPPLKAGQDNAVTIQHYLQEIFLNLHRLEVVSTSPDTVRNGKKGDMLLYISGATYRLYLNVDGAKSWKYTTLS